MSFVARGSTYTQFIIEEASPRPNMPATCVLAGMPPEAMQREANRTALQPVVREKYLKGRHW
jgi:hypothetical protein